MKIVISIPSKKSVEAFRLISQMLLGIDPKKSREYTFKKNSFKLFLLVSKIFLGANFENSQDYTFKKNSLNSFVYFEPFPRCIF